MLDEQRLEKARLNMVQQQIRPWEVLDPRVLEVLGQMHRERFAPKAYLGLAFADVELPLGQGQTMLAPKIEARILQALELDPKDRVLEIGTGSGYLTACLARLSHHVITLEIRPEFAALAERRMHEQGIGNVRVITGDAFALEIPDAPFDAIAVTGSLPLMDNRLLHLLAPGGRLFAVTGQGIPMEANLMTRVGEEQWRTEVLFETHLPALENAPTPEAFCF